MPKKVTNIYKRKDGRWEARYVKAIGLDGKRRYGSAYGNTYEEARGKQLFHIQNSGIKNYSGSIFLADLAYEWLAVKENSIKLSTFQKYESMVKKHIVEHQIGNVPVSSLTTTVISSYSKEKLTKCNLSDKTVNSILNLIGMILSYSEEVHGFKKPRIIRVKETIREMRVLSTREQAILESYLFLSMDIYRFGVLLALYTGIRIGELCALNWTDIQDGQLLINKTMQRIRKGEKTIVEITDPKTQSSNRIIPLSDFILPLVEQFRDNGFVLKTRKGNVVEPRVMQLKFENMIMECGLKRTNFHALRHTFATRCIEAGFDVKSLSEILGHSDVKTTLNKYVHSSLEQKQRNMEKLIPLYNQ